MAVIRAPNADEAAKLVEPYLVETGGLVYAWNALQEELANLFWRVTGIQNGAIPFAIWHSTPSDYSQRAMLRAAAEVAYADNKKARDEIVWLLDKIDNSLRHKRNDAIHAPVILLTDGGGSIVVPQDFTNNPRALALHGKDLLKELIWYRQTAEVLRRHCWHLRHALKTQPGPLPERPTLPHLGPLTHSKGTSQGKPGKEPRRPSDSIREA